MFWIRVVHVGVLLVMVGLVVRMLSVVLMLASFTMISHRCCVLVVGMLHWVVLRVSRGLIFDSLVVMSSVVSLTITVLEVFAFGVLVLTVWVVAMVSMMQSIVCMTDSLKVMLRVMMSLRVARCLVMIDQRGIVSMSIDISVMWGDCCVMNRFGNYCVVRSHHFVMDGLFVFNLGIMVHWLRVVRHSLHVVVLLSLMRGLGIVVSLNMVRVLVMWLLRVHNLMVLWESTSMAIVVVHLEHQVSVLNINLA